MPASRPNRVVRSISTTEALWDEVTQAASREGVSQSAIVIRALAQYFASKIMRSSWETDDEDSWYNSRKFYTYSEDKKGHSAYVRMWIPKNLAGQIGRVVNSGQIPEYRSSQDFYRDALFHRVHQVGEWLDDGELKGELGMAMLIAEEDRLTQERKDLDLLMSATKENLEEAWAAGHYHLLEERVNDRIEKAGSIAEQFRGDYMALLKVYKGRLAEVHKGKVKRIPRQRPETAND